jgi:hypothetical protein
MKKINIIAKIKEPLGDEQITDTIAYLDYLWQNYVELNIALFGGC